MFLPSLSVLRFFPEYRSTQTPWQGLTPVAAWAIEAIRPARFVELGAYRGDSFFSFLQASQNVPEVRDLCAIDTWAGDIHTGDYGDAVHAQFTEELGERGDPRARFLRTTFADAALAFDDRSIDLLHIDGAHDYASVREDFETWLPKMTAEGVILFHDTVVRQKPYAVWRLWEEIATSHPGRTCNFTFSNGLGVLCLGSGTEHDFQHLVGQEPKEQARIDRMMAMVGQRVLATTEFEARLAGAGDHSLPDSYVFARGEDLEKIGVLMEAASTIPATTLHRSIDPLGENTGGDLFAALRPKLDDYVRQSLDQRVEALLSEQANDLFAALRPKLDDYVRQSLDQRVEALLSEQANDLFAALRPKLDDYVRQSLDQRVEALLSEQADDLFATLRPKLDEYIEVIGNRSGRRDRA